MKKFVLLASLILMLSCSSDNDNQPVVTIEDHARITTWKLVSIKDANGNEIATDCELQNGTIIVNFDPQRDAFDQELAAIMQGVEDNGCQAMVRNNVLWYQFGTDLNIRYESTSHYYDHHLSFENDTQYMSLVFKGHENSVQVPIEERKTCKYRCESIVYPN